MLNIFCRNCEIPKVPEIHAQIDIEQLVTARAASETIKDECWTIQIPSGRVTRAETWLTVYRSPYIKLRADHVPALQTLTTGFKFLKKQPQKNLAVASRHWLKRKTGLTASHKKTLSHFRRRLLE